MTPFSLWLEFEHWEAREGYDPTDDFCNIMITLEDGRAFALNVWTFRFLQRARFPWPYQSDHGQAEEYVVAPDLFVERLDRPLIERVVAQLIHNSELKPGWLVQPTS